MPIEYEADEIAQLEGPFCSFAGLVRVGTPDPLRLWTGIGDFPVDDSAFDPDGSVFKGSRLVDLPSFIRIWNGLSERIDVLLDGVSDEMRDRVYEEADDIRGAHLRMAIVVLGANYEQVGPPRWLRRGRVDVIETDNQAAGRERIKTIKFSLGSQLTGRMVPGSGVYTNADQQSRPGSEDDRFCERTPGMTQQKTIRWPDFVFCLFVAKGVLAMLTAASWLA